MQKNKKVVPAQDRAQVLGTEGLDLNPGPGPELGVRPWGKLSLLRVYTPLKRKKIESLTPEGCENRPNQMI